MLTTITMGESVKVVYRCAMIGLVVLSLQHHSQGAVPDFTCYNLRLYVKYGTPPYDEHLIGGYKSGSDTSATVSFERVLDTGSGSDLPAGGYEEDHPYGTVSARLYYLPYSIGADRFGAYNCIFRSQDPVKITTIILRENGDVSPASPTLTTSAGEDVTLTMTQLYNGSSTELRWRHNGVDVTAWDGQSSISIPNVQVNHAGIYECYRDGRYDQQNHAIMKLLVRQCSPNKWGPSCDICCPFCYNGGQCDDMTGECICAPGFSGSQCNDTLCGINWFGQDSQIMCSEIPDRACRGNLMCSPDPFGCTCAASFTGRNCEDDCDDGYFGAGCKLRCNCDGDAVCDKGHGKCPTGVQCATGFTGENCQVCPNGWFGVNCIQQCHCADDAVCDKGIGICSNGKCRTGFRGEHCQNSCPHGYIGLHPNCTVCYVPVSVSFQASSEQDPTRTITWKPPQNKCPVIDYAVQYQLVNRDHCQEVDVEFETLHNTTERQSTLPHPDSSLVANSIYMVRVLARNEAGLGEFQEESYIEHTTPAKEPTGSPTEFKLSSKAKHRLAFSWSEILCGQRNGAITGYTLSYRVLEKPYEINFRPNSSFEMVDIEPPCLHHNISGLEPSTKYELHLAGFNSVGTGGKASLEEFTSVETEIEPPPKPSNDPDEATSTTVTIGLKLPSSSRYITGIQIGVVRRQLVVTNENIDSRQLRSSDVTMTVDYVAAELHKEELPETFTVGDGKSYGGYDNKPLKSNTTYDLYTGSVSRVSDTEMFVAWGDPITVEVPPDGFPVLIVAVVVPILIVVIVICVVIGCIKIRSKNRNRKMDRSLQSHEMKGSLSKTHDETSCSVVGNIVSTSPMSSEPAGQDQPSPYESVGAGSVTTYEDVGLPTWAQPWSVLWVDMMVGSKVLGEGHFGEVRLGGVMKQGEISKAAIKQLKAHASVTDRKNFMTEFRAMTQVGHHPNVVQILGVCQHEDELYIAVEYLPNGDLRSFLRKARDDGDDGSQASLTSEKLLQLALGVAKGMQHLAASGVIHRDLAARNILLDDNLVAKVSDFGLSRGENVYVQQSKTRVPTRWLSLESLFNQTYTTKSDVWSFGILLWEIATFGGTPYSGIKTQVLATKLRNGYRMPKPDNCSDEIYKLMLKCWEEDPNNRPEFRTLVSILTSLGESHIEHTYMKVPVKSENMTYENIRREFDDN